MRVKPHFGQVDGIEMAGTVTAHPMAGHGYDYDVPLLAGRHVTTEQGTGFVHIAPGHGVEDFELAPSRTRHCGS